MNWVLHGFSEALLMLWQTLWALVLGYSISALLQVFVRREHMTQRFGRASLKSMGWAILLGAVSSSCSYAAAAAGKTAFRKGAALPVALAFTLASTNLVVELSAVLWVLMGRIFVFAEFVGAFVLVGTMWLITRLTLSKTLEEGARRHSSGSGGMMEGHGDGAHASGSRWVLLAGAFWTDVGMVWKEILGGFVVAEFLMVLVPNPWWQTLFLTHATPPIRLFENAIVGPIIAMASFVCSVGNLPLASWLWSHGIGFGGVVSFIFADLIIVPLILIYRKYYGGRAAAYITAVMFASMVISGILVDLLFTALGLIPRGPRPPSPMETAHFAWNYTTWLDIVAVGILGFLILVRSQKDRPGRG